MDKEVEEYYEGYFEMFNTKGWKDFKQTLIDKMNTERDGWSDVDEANLFFQVKGRLTILDEIVKIEDTIRLGYEAVSNQNEGDDE